MRTSIGTLVAIGLLAQSSIGMAQNHAGTSYAARDVNASIGVTLPFGGAPQRDEPARVELTLGQDRITADGARLNMLNLVRGDAPQRVRVGLTLEPQARFTINGRAVQGPIDDRRGASTLGKVAIGVGVAFGVVLAAGIIALATYGPTD